MMPRRWYVGEGATGNADPPKALDRTEFVEAGRVETGLPRSKPLA